jgi:hypothetical protein
MKLTIQERIVAAMVNEVKAEGFAYDPATRDWTKRVEITLRNRTEALNWIEFNRNWMKNLRVID